MPKTQDKSTSPKKRKDPSKDPSFEEAMTELEDITRKLESGSLSLDDSIRAYERGTELQKICQAKLDEAQAKLEYLSRKQDGSLERNPVPAIDEELSATEQARLFQD